MHSCSFLSAVTLACREAGAIGPRPHWAGAKRWGREPMASPSGARHARRNSSRGVPMRIAVRPLRRSTTVDQVTAAAPRARSLVHPVRLWHRVPTRPRGVRCADAMPFGPSRRASLRGGSRRTPLRLKPRPIRVSLIESRRPHVQDLESHRASRRLDCDDGATRAADEATTDRCAGPIRGRWRRLTRPSRRGRIRLPRRSPHAVRERGCRSRRSR